MGAQLGGSGPGGSCGSGTAPGGTWCVLCAWSIAVLLLGVGQLR